MATMYDLIPTPYAVRGKAVTEIRCPMLTPAAANHELQHGRPRQVWIAGDDRAYGDVLEAVNAIEQRLGRFDDKSPVYVCCGDLDVCLVAVLLERLREAGSDADVMLARQIVRCTHSTKAVTRRDALDMKKERPGRPRANPGVSAANRERKKRELERYELPSPYLVLAFGIVTICDAVRAAASAPAGWVDGRGRRRR